MNDQTKAALREIIELIEKEWWNLYNQDDSAGCTLLANAMDSLGAAVADDDEDDDEQDEED